MSPTNRFTGKSALLGVAYGMDFAKAEQRVASFYGSMLDAKRRPWARAFKEVLGVGAHFYVNADTQRKDWLEAHYRELATHDTPKGRKAAKVVARIAVLTAIARLDPEPMYLALHSMNHDELVFEAKTGRVSAELTSAQVDMYRYLYGVPKK